MTAELFDLDAHRQRRADANRPEKWVRIERVVEHFDVSRRTVERWLDKGLRDDAQAVRKPSRRLLLFRLTEVDRWLSEQA